MSNNSNIDNIALSSSSSSSTNPSENEQLYKFLGILGRQCLHSEKYIPTQKRLARVIAALDRDAAYQDQEMTYFSLAGGQYETLRKVMDLLLTDDRIPNESRKEKREIYNELLDYCREIFNNKDSIIKKQQDIDKDIGARAEAFLNRLLMQEQKWLVISPINGLSLEKKENITILLDQVIIKWFDLQIITDFAGSLAPYHQKKLEEDLQGNVCVFMFVMAIDWKRALEKARKKIGQILHIMRLHFGTHVFHSLPTPKLFKAINKESVAESRPRELQDEICIVSPDEQDELSKHMSSFSDFLDGDNSSSSSVPKEMKKALLRAIRWFGGAVQAKDLEDKLVRYFFALETLLIPEELGPKRERLVFRWGLLHLRVQGELPSLDFACELDRLYQKRSNIVHGGDIEENPITEEDTSFLERRTREVIIAISRIFMDKQRAISNIRELRDWLELDIRQKESNDKDEEGDTAFSLKLCRQN